MPSPSIAEPGEPAKERLFVALELPEDVRVALVAWRPRDGGLRPVAAESLHVTLAFLGWREAADADMIGALLLPLGRPLHDVAIGGARWLPPRRPRVLAVEIEDGEGAMGALAADVVGALERDAGFVAERRAFLPHVTVARVRAGGANARRRRGTLPPPPRMRFRVPALTLFRSRLSPSGARYEALARVSL
jgi:2'-5' RNA ligase